jgi:TPR repeat protein
MKQRGDKIGECIDDLAQLHRLADAGDAEALYILGLRYSNGDGVMRDVVIGSRLLYLASQKGNVKAEKVLDAFWGD